MLSLQPEFRELYALLGYNKFDECICIHVGSDLSTFLFDQPRTNAEAQLLNSVGVDFHWVNKLKPGAVQRSRA